MSEAENTVQKPTWFVRAFIIVLPVGLAIMVPISLVIYYQRKHRPEPSASQYAAMLRRELSADDFARYRRILEQDIGERTLAQKENLEAAASYIESTLGYDNMGYAAKRLAFLSGDLPPAAIVAELPGKGKAQEEVLVLASYDHADAQGAAALLCLAHALTGTTHARTIRFAVVVNGAAEDAAANGLTRLAAPENQGTTRKVAAVALFSPGLDRAATTWSGARVLSLEAMLREASKAPLERLREALTTIKETAEAP